MNKLLGDIFVVVSSTYYRSDFLSTNPCCCAK